MYLKTQQSFARNEEDIDTVNAIGEWFNNFEEALKNLFGDTSIKLKFDYRNLNFKISHRTSKKYTAIFNKILSENTVYNNNTFTGKVIQVMEDSGIVAIRLAVNSDYKLLEVIKG